MNSLKNDIGFIGAGNMASALIAGLINGGMDPKEIIASSPEDSHLLAKRCESSGELAMISFGSIPPLINPAIRALAMFPAPINPMSFLREFIVLAQISWSLF